MRKRQQIVSGSNTEKDGVREGEREGREGEREGRGREEGVEEEEGGEGESV